ncbi:PAS domain S-box protein [Actinoplanes xinjiangensis]|uniref:PAS domain S-box protein n=1 Tax=Actinoplanes xinjiangensis TaxID=512350 RepID=UPI00344650F1
MSEISFSWPVADRNVVSDSHRPLQGPDRGRRLAPFVVMAVAGVISLAIPPWPQLGPTLFAGIGVLVAVVIGAVVLPWARWPAQAQAAPALAFYVALALLRHATGGSTSGLAPLAALPVVWLALYGTRAEMLTAVASCGLMFLAPAVVLGAPLYPVQDWHRALLWSAVAMVIGASIHRLVHSRERHASSLDQLLTLTRQMDDTNPAIAREQACSSVVEIMQASFAVMMEPDGKGNLVSTAIVGTDLPTTVIPMTGTASGTLIAFTSGKRLFIADAPDSPLVSQQLVAATGAASVVFEPIHRDGHVIGVLSIGYTSRQTDLDSDATAILELITTQLSALTTRVDLAERLEALAADASDMVSRYTITDDGFRFSYASPSAHALLGRRPEDLVGTSPSELMHPDDMSALSHVSSALLTGRTATTVAYRARHADGHWVWIETTVRPIVDALTGRVTEIQATSRDVSDRKQMEIDLRRANTLFTGVLSAATEYSIIGTDPDGTINVFNTGAERLLGYRASEVIGQTTPALIHDPAEVVQQAEELGVEPGFEVFVTLARQGQAASREWTYVTKDGRRVHVSLTVTAMRDAEGRISGFIGIARDLADQDAAMKAMDDAYQREQAVVAELRTVARTRDHFVAAVTHDLRVPLTSIRGYTEILLDADTALPDSLGRMLTVIDRNAERLLKLVDDLLTTARMEAGKLHLVLAPVEIAGFIHEICESFRPETIRRHITFEVAAVGELGTVSLDRHHIERVLSNLVSNAVKFTPDGGTVSVEASKGADELTITVTDTGIGIPEAEIGQLFTPFSRASTASKEQTPGTGLGLTIVKAIVEQHGGTISLTSHVGSGTAVTVRLPASSSPSHDYASPDLQSAP